MSHLNTITAKYLIERAHVARQCSNKKLADLLEKAITNYENNEGEATLLLELIIKVSERNAIEKINARVANAMNQTLDEMKGESESDMEIYGK